MTLMDKISNFALNPTHMQQAHYFRHILHAEEITGRPEGVGHRSMSTPINTPLDSWTTRWTTPLIRRSAREISWFPRALGLF